MSAHASASSLWEYPVQFVSGLLPPPLGALWPQHFQGCRFSEHWTHEQQTASSKLELAEISSAVSPSGLSKVRALGILEGFQGN